MQMLLSNFMDAVVRAVSSPAQSLLAEEGREETYTVDVGTRGASSVAVHCFFP